jgi:hypothetical protein
MAYEIIETSSLDKISSPIIHLGRIDVMKGDTVTIPIFPKLLETATYRCQLRKNTNSLEFYVLVIENANIIITAAQSETMTPGYWYAELEENDRGKITTLQRITVYVSSEITRTFGNPAPEWKTDQSAEVAEMIAGIIYIRKQDNSLINIDDHVIDADKITGEIYGGLFQP